MKNTGNKPADTNIFRPSCEFLKSICTIYMFYDTVNHIINQKEKKVFNLISIYTRSILRLVVID